MRRLAAGVLLAGLAAGCAAAQDAAAPAPATDAATLKLGTSLVYVPVQVEVKGQVLYGLRPDQFVLEDNGVPQQFQMEEDTDALGLSMVVVVQCSREAYEQFGRMRGLGALVDDVAGGGPHEVAVVSYGTEINLVGKFTTRADRLAAHLAEVQPCAENGAVTLDAVDYANKLFDRSPSTVQSRNRRVILLVSETRDHGSKMRAEDVVAGLGRSNTVVDAVSFSPGKTFALDTLKPGRSIVDLRLFAMAVNALRKNVPHTLAALSGGEYTNFTTEKGFEAGVHRLANHVHNYYLLSFRPAAGAAPGLHALSVRVPEYPQATVRARLSWYAGDVAPETVPEER